MYTSTIHTYHVGQKIVIKEIEKRWEFHHDSNQEQQKVVSKTSQTYNFSSSVTFLLITDRHLRVLARNASPPGIVAALDPADANDLNDFAPEADGRAVESLFVGVDAGSLPDQICLVRADESGALEELPSSEGDGGCEMMLLGTKTETSKLGSDSDLPRISMV
jgi:hypothetical protein